MRGLLLFALGLGVLGQVHAIEVDVSKRTTPGEVLNPNRGRIDPWLDPEKINRVNEIVRKDHVLKVTVDRAAGQVGLDITCKSKRSTTFFFADAQRVDVLISRGGRVVYKWSSNKRFVKATGTSVLMPGESMVFAVSVPSGQLSPGSTVEVRLTGYPEFTASTGL